LNNHFRQKIRIAGRFAGFLIKSGNRYRIHSPFLYSLVGEVIRSGKRVEGEEAIELLRRRYLESNEIIIKTDFGAGAGDYDKITRRVGVKKIAMTSLTSRKHARRLNRLIRYLELEKVLEIGTSLGISTAYLSIANPGARIITLEGCPETSRIAQLNFNELGLKNVDLIEGRFENTLPEALEKLGSVDLVFIDGNHRRHAVMEYFDKCLEFANNDTVIVVDDIHSSKDMEQAWEEARNHPRVTVSLDLFYSGWIFLRKESSRQHFRLRYI